MNDRSRTVTKAELAEALNVKPRTVTRWVAKGCPNERGPAGQLLFDLAEVVAWRRQRDAEAVDDDADERGPPPAADPTQATLRKAELARKLTLARRTELELAAERGLKDLELGDKIRAAKTHDDMLAISSEVCALIGSGDLSPTRGRAIQALLAEMRRSLKEHLGAEGGEDPERIVLLSEEGTRLVEDFEAIVSDERRAQILEHVAQQRAVDEEESPNVDLAALTPDEAEALGLDLPDGGDDALGGEEVRS